jgi:hypothetical protein
MTEKRLKKKFDWDLVWTRLRQLISVSDLPDGDSLWRADQEKSLTWIAERLQQQAGVLIADEVGLGKTRLAIALAVCVASCGGRVAIMIPPGLTYQWCDEELRGFLAQISRLQLQWVPVDIKTKVLRTYPDLFDGGKNSPKYPLSSHAEFVFLSHRFGLPQRLPSVKQEELWALPFAVKRKLVKDRRSVPGAGKLTISAAQQVAVGWLAENVSNPVQRRLLAARMGRVSKAAFSVPQNGVLFRNLIGELVGNFELVIIDEAHKSRAGAAAASDKKANTIMQSRMSACLNDILMRPGSASKHAKRVALTATPMEMDAKQWAGVLHRLGLPPAQVDSLTKTVNAFADAVKEIRTGSETEILNLENTAHAFQTELRPLVTRRLWRDHPCVQRFAENHGNPNAAHPHRRMIVEVASLSKVAPAEKLHLAYAEGLAMASKGMLTEHGFKTAGSRHSQGLPLLSESVTDLGTSESLNAGPLDSTPAAIAEHGKRQRQSYWIDRLKSLSHEMGPVAKKPRWSLQWHPKVRHAVSLIERLTGQGRKVLVFGEFIEPIRALDRALNIRHYLRHVRARNPIPVPAGVRTDDPDVMRWLESADMKFNCDQVASFAADSVSLSLQYVSDRAGLREACSAAVEEFFDHAQPGPVQICPELKQALLTWLVQQLCVSDQFSVYAGAKGREVVKSTVEQLLRDLKDADPAGKADSDDADAAKRFDWDRAIREQEKDLERDSAGNYVFRMSPFSQMLYGETKPATRRVRQSTFNNPQLNPQVLIGQSAVASEGLNLHRACRSVVLFHLDWNPGRIEQQIGRVDRQDSAWMADFAKWDHQGDAPQIDIYTMALEGTYDAFRTNVVHQRAKVLRSQLFGEILPLDQLSQLDEDVQAAIGQIRIDFRP